jgi:hypothetical protein
VSLRRSRPRRSDETLAEAVRNAGVVALVAGSKPHKFTSLWAVVVGSRVFVRSWSVKPRSWYRTLLEEPRGVLKVREHRVRFRAVRTRSTAIKAAVDRGYRAKYDRPGDLRFTRDMTGPTSRATTTELVLG